MLKELNNRQNKAFGRTYTSGSFRFLAEHLAKGASEFILKCFVFNTLVEFADKMPTDSQRFHAKSKRCFTQVLQIYVMLVPSRIIFRAEKAHHATCMISEGGAARVH